MKETVWTGKVSISASNPDNWSDGLPNSYDREGVIPENRYDYDYEPDWDIADFTILIRIEGEPAQISIGSNCFFNGECYAPQAIIDYVGSLVLDEPLSYGGEYGGLFSADVDFPTTRISEDYVIAASNATNWEKSQSHFVCSGSNDEVDIQRYLDKLPTGSGKLSLTSGSFDIKATLDVEWGQTIEGSGMRQTTLDWTGGADDVIIINSAQVAHDTARGGGIRELEIYGNDNDTAGIRVRWTWGTVIENVTMQYNGDDSIIVESSYDTYIHNCGFRWITNTNISLRSYDSAETTYCKISGCEITGDNGAGEYGVEILSGTDVVIENCWFESHANSAVTAHIILNYANGNCHITDNLFGGGSANAEVVIQVDNGVAYVNHNYMRGNPATNNHTLIKVDGGSLLCDDNDFVGWGNTAGSGIGVDINGGDTIKIMNNRFVGNATNAGFAIDIGGGQRITVGGNDLRYGGGIKATTTNVLINDNILRELNDSETYGIYVTSHYNIISNNEIYEIEKGGIYNSGVYNVIQGNIVAKVGQDVTDTYYGINCSGFKTSIVGNICLSIGAIKTKYGLYINGLDDSPISNNIIDDMSSADIFFNGTCERITLTYNHVIDGTVTLPSNTDGWVISGNIGFIAPGEIRSKSGVLTAGVANAIFFAWANPEAQDILVKKVVIGVTTAGGTAASLGDVGIADDAAGTNRGTEFFDDIDMDAAQINNSYLAGDGGTQTKYVLCQDSGSGTDAFIVGQILAQNAASLVGRYYIEYMGR